MAKSRGRKFAEITSPTSGVFDLTSVPTITNAKLQNSAMTLAGSSVSLGGTGVANTDALSEGSSNLYFTDARVQTFLGGGTLAGNIVVPDNRSIYFGNSSDFRIVHSTSGNLTQLINNTGALEVTSNGGFDVTGAATFSSTIAASGNIGVTKETPVITLTDSSASRTIQLIADDNNSVVRASGTLLLQAGGATNALAFDASRNATFSEKVGIGTSTTPGALLEIKSSDDPLLILHHTEASDNAAMHFKHGGTTNGHIYVNNDRTMYFSTVATNPAMVIKAAGNVGIGTGAGATADYRLHLVDTIADQDPILYAAASGTPANNFNWIAEFMAPNIAQDKRVTLALGKARSSNNAATMSYVQRADTNDNALTFGHFGNNDLVSFCYNGSVGIGTTTPPHKLSVFGTGAGNATVQIEGEGGADPYINFLANNTMHWSAGIDDSDADKFKISKHSALGTNDYFTLATNGHATFNSFVYLDYIRGKSDSNTGVNVAGSDVLELQTGGDVKLKIDSNGNVGIGKDPGAVRLDVTTANNGNLAAEFINTHSTGSYGVKIRAGSSSSNYSFAIADKDNSITRFFFRGDGNLGVGTTSPETLLHISAANGGDPSVRLQAGSSADARIDFEDSGGTVRWYKGYDVSSGNFVIASDENGFGGRNIMCMDDDGNVGIATHQPDFKLHIGRDVDNLGSVTTNKQILINLDAGYSTNNSKQYKAIAFNGTTNGGADDVFGSTYTSGEQLKNFVMGIFSDYAYFNSSHFAIVQGAGYRFAIRQGGNVGLGLSNPGQKFHTYKASAENWMFENGTSGTTGKIYLKTSDNADLSKYITMSGYWTEVGVHNNEGFRIRGSDGNIKLTLTGAAGNLSVAGSGSDRNFKKDIKDIDTAIDIVKAAKPKTFEFIKHVKRKAAGFIAQDMQEILPDLVSGEEYDEEIESSGLGFDYIGYTAYLTKALQESIARIEALEAEVKALKE